MTMMMIAQGVGKGVQAGSRLAQPRFQNSRYGRLLRDRKKQGNLTPGQEMNVLGRTATTATKQANLANKRYMGSMINKGLQGSVSAQRGLREAEADVRRTVADTGKDIYQSEEQAKSKAKLDYARGIDQDKSERFKAGLGVVSAGVETFANLQGKKAQEQQATDQSYADAMNKYGTKEIPLPGHPTENVTVGNFDQYTTPSGKIRYAGAGLTQDDKRAVEVYTQKANIKNVSNVTNAFSALQSGEIDGAEFREQLKSGSDPLTDEQIDELFAHLAKIGS